MSWDHVPSLDEEVKVAHKQDHDRAEELLNYLVDLPPKAQAMRAIVRALEQARMDGVYNPPVAREINRRRVAREMEELKSNTVLSCGCKVFKDNSRILCVTHARLCDE